VSEIGFTSEQRKRLYTDEKSTEKGEIKDENRKVKREKRASAATLSDLYHSTCLTWKALPGV